MIRTPWEIALRGKTEAGTTMCSTTCSSRVMPRTIGGYHLPNCLTSEEDMQRVLHRDLSSMTDSRLFAETHRVRAAFAAAEGRSMMVMPGPGPTCDLLDVSAWLRNRYRALLTETQRRKGSAR